MRILVPNLFVLLYYQYKDAHCVLQWQIQDLPRGRGPVRGRGPPMRVLFSENVCENERIASRRGVCAGHGP